MRSDPRGLRRHVAGGADGREKEDCSSSAASVNASSWEPRCQALTLTLMLSSAQSILQQRTCGAVQLVLQRVLDLVLEVLGNVDIDWLDFDGLLT